jgi:hypothetical protein
VRIKGGNFHTGLGAGPVPAKTSPVPARVGLCKALGTGPA